MSAFAQIAYDRDGSVATIELRNPKTRNALSETMREELLVACDVIRATPEIRAVVLTGAGGDFSSGADLREFGLADSVCSARRVRQMHNIYRRFLTLDRPTIAVIDGVAVGGGLELALSCDIRIAVAGCRVGLPEVRRGFIPGGGGTQLVGRRTAGRAADAVVLGGSLIDAERARRYGFVHEVCLTVAEARGRAAALAVDLAHLDRDTVLLIKRRLLELS